MRLMQLVAVMLVAPLGQSALRAEKPGAAEKDSSLFGNVRCEGYYPHHLQGICTNDKDALYWSFTTTLVKTDRAGKVQKKIPVVNHHGDLCHRNGKLYVAVNLGRFNDPDGRANSWVYVYDAKTLAELARHKTPEVVYGAGGIDYDNGRFIVIGGLPKGVEVNYAYAYDRDFKFVKRHVIKSGYTRLGIQTATCAKGTWWFGCYGRPAQLLKTDRNFKMLGRYDFDCGMGIVDLADGSFLVAKDSSKKGKGRGGKVLIAQTDEKSGLKPRASRENKGE